VVGRLNSLASRTSLTHAEPVSRSCSSPARSNALSNLTDVVVAGGRLLECRANARGADVQCLWRPEGLIVTGAAPALLSYLCLASAGA